MPPQRSASLFVSFFISLYADSGFVLEFILLIVKTAAVPFKPEIEKVLWTSFDVFVYVFAGTEVGSVLTSVTANDVDTYPALKYSLTQGDNRFSIDRYSGKIVLNKALDFETKKVYEVNVSVSDNEHVAKTTLTINVLDINDNSPVFDEISYNRILPGKLNIIIIQR